MAKYFCFRMRARGQDGNTFDVDFNVENCIMIKRKKGINNECCKGSKDVYDLGFELLKDDLLQIKG